MNQRDIGGRPAVLQYLDGEYRVVTPGNYVVCAVTGTKISGGAALLSVDLQLSRRSGGCVETPAGKGPHESLGTLFDTALSQAQKRVS